MNDARRRILLFTVLAGALAWSGWLVLNESPKDDTAGLVEVADSRARPAARSPARPTPALHKAQHEIAPRMAAARANLFPKQTWFIPPPPPPPPPPTPPP
ncbi:MAG: hypothetical protein WBZ31_03135, partial [Thiobacillus sp.]